MLKIITVTSFIAGVVIGFGLNLIISLLMWLAIGFVLVLAFDVATGLSQRACGMRASIRSWFANLRVREPAPPARSTIWIKI